MKRKHPLETTDYIVGWTERLSGDSISTSTFTVLPSGLTLTNTSHTADTATVFLSGGIEGQPYRFTNTITTTGNRTLVSEFTVLCTSVPPVVTLAQIQSDILPSLEFEDQHGRPLSTDTLQTRLDSAITQFEQRMGIRFQPTRVKCGKLAFENEVFVEQFEGIDYNWEETEAPRYSSMYLPVKPIIEIESLGIRVPGTSNLRIIPANWAQPERNSRKGYLRVSPGETLNLPSYRTSSFYLPLTYHSQIVPGGWHILYTAGYTAAELEANPWIGLGMAKIAALEMLTPGSIDKFLAKGLAGVSVSADGLSQSTNLMQNSNQLKYAALAAQLEKEVGQFVADMKKRHSGVVAGFV